MRQPEDDKTFDLNLDEKRGRGRPPKPDALTGAERSKRFRDAHRGQRQQANIPATEMVTKREFDELQRTLRHRTFALESAHAEIRILTAKLAEKG